MIILAHIHHNGRINMNKNIKEFLELIDEYMSPINKEIKDDKKAEEVWALMGELENKLEENKYE